MVRQLVSFVEDDQISILPSTINGNPPEMCIITHAQFQFYLVRLMDSHVSISFPPYTFISILPSTINGFPHQVARKKIDNFNST